MTAFQTTGIAPGDSHWRRHMDKKIAGLLGAVATLGAMNAAQAAPAPAPTDVMRANSFADLLEPIPNAAKVLQAIDESAPAQPADPNIQLAQIVIGVGHHHHHHHHHAYRRGPRIVIGPRRHHHHHHHHGYDR
jgi:hypothetical protein